MSRSTFKGSVPSLPCRDVSGADCDRMVPGDAVHCGYPEHARLSVAESPKYDEDFVSRPGRRKAKLTVNEDYDLLGPERDLETDRALPDLDPETLDSSRLWVGTKVQQGFTAHHGTDAQTAIDELRFFVGEALNKGRYTRLDDGCHRLSYRSFSVLLSPDGGTVISYSTLHYERTPRQVLEGVRSRFGRGRNGGVHREPGPPLTLSELVSTFDPATVPIVHTALSLYAKKAGIEGSDEAVEVAMRAELAQAADSGTWRESERGPTAFVLETPARHWIVGADDGTIIAHYLPDRQPAEDVHHPPRNNPSGVETANGTQAQADSGDPELWVVRLRRTELKCLIDLYYSGRTDHELLKICARALEVGKDRKAPGSVEIRLSGSQRDTLLTATKGRRVACQS